MLSWRALCSLKSSAQMSGGGPVHKSSSQRLEAVALLDLDYLSTSGRDLLSSSELLIPRYEIVLNLRMEVLIFR